MAEKMTLEQVRDWHLQRVLKLTSDAAAAEHYNMASAITAHLTQHAQAVDVEAEDRFEQYVKTLIDKAPDVQKLGERLAHLLDEDQFNNIEPTLLGIARALDNANGKEG